MGAHDAARLAHRAFGIEAFADHLAQADRLREMHDRVAAVEDHRQQASKPADHRPVLRKQHAEPTGFAGRRAANENRYRHDADIQMRVHPHRIDQLRQAFGMGAIARSSKNTVAPRHRQHRTPFAQVAARHWQQRWL